MGHRCFISFKKEDEDYKIKIQNELDVDMIDYSLDDAINSEDEEYIIRKLRKDYISKSTVTIHLIGKYSAEILGPEEQKFIKRELKASLFHGDGNTQSGILGVVLPSMTSEIYKGSSNCLKCGNSHNYVNINDETTIKEFSYNYYLPKAEDKCAWAEEDRFCVLVTWDEFEKDPNKYIDMAFEKRKHPISEKTKVRP